MARFVAPLEPLFEHGAVRFVCAALVVAVFTTRVAAEESEAPPKVALSLAIGAATAIAPLAAGGATFAARDEVDTRKAGIYTMLTGLTLAPLASHLIGREYRRALYFTAAPLAGSITAIALLESHPELLDHGHPAMRVGFGIGISVAILGAIVGLADSAGARDRWRPRQRQRIVSLADSRSSEIF
jgi:hypothetical protein